MVQLMVEIDMSLELRIFVRPGLGVREPSGRCRMSLRESLGQKLYDDDDDDHHHHHQAPSSPGAL